VHALLAWEPQAIDAPLLERGRSVGSRYGLSWWASLVVAAAQTQGCSLLLTEDLQDGAVYGGVSVRSPFTLSLDEGAAAYAAAPSAAQRPRRRGRPRALMARQPRPLP